LFVDKKSAEFRFQQFYKSKETDSRFSVWEIKQGQFMPGKGLAEGEGYRLVEMVGIKI
jgi:hypothetical protein